MHEELGKTEASLVAARREHLAALRLAGRDPFTQTRFERSTLYHALSMRPIAPVFPPTGFPDEIQLEGQGHEGGAHISIRKDDLALPISFAQLANLFEYVTTDNAEPSKRLQVAGRVLTRRGMGKTSFFDLADASESKLQVYARRDDLGEEPFAALGHVERGDIVGVEGYLFRSKMGELTLHATAITVLGKGLTPLPDKWHGLLDVEKRYRQRYVDLIVNQEVRHTFLTRSRILSEMRRFIDARGFHEVETATLLHVAGGASARPFLTHVNALDAQMQLRIATELNLKRLIVGGMERVYEIGRIFRNEGIDTSHNPEFTMLELYAAYWDVEDMLSFNEALLEHLARVVIGSTTLKVGAHEISFARPFARIGYLEGIAKYSDGRYTRDRLLDDKGAAEILHELGLPRSPTHAHALDKIFERVLEPHLIAPTFVTEYPLAISPLAKKTPNDPQMTQRYELFVAQMEVSNAFSELNDPDDQRERFEAQIAQRAQGDDEIPDPDWDFVRALEIGMPPTAGIGIGIDRLVMLLTGQSSIRDVILFPLQRQHG